MGLLPSKNQLTVSVIDVQPAANTMEEVDGDHKENSRQMKKSEDSEVSFKRDLEEFTSVTTIHGLRFLPDLKYPLSKRLIWMVLLLSGIAMCINETYMTLETFLAYEVTTSAKKVYTEELPFPAVTICNFNKYRRSYTTDNANFSRWIYEVYSTKNVYYDQIPPNGELVADINRTEFMLEAAHQKETMILSCIWKGEICDPEYWTTSFTDFGLCYTFNGDPENVLFVEESGLESALTIILDIELEEYDYGNDYIEGFSTIIHNQDEPPLLSYRGAIFTPTGRQAVVGLQRAEIISLSSPYSTKCLSSGTKYQARYSRDQCYIEKAAFFSEETCGCIEPNMPGTARICNFNESYYCVRKKLPGMMKTVCRDVPCHQIALYPQISYAKMPSWNYLDDLTFFFQKTEEELKENFAALKIFYLSMSYELIEERPLVTTQGLVSGIGGIMGICIGASFLSIYELCDFLLLSAWKQIKVFGKKN